MVFISYSSLDYVMTNPIRKILQKNDLSCMLRYMFLKVLKNHDQIPILLFLQNLDYTGLWANESEFLCEQILKNMQALGFDVSRETFKRSLLEIQRLYVIQSIRRVA